MIPPAYVGIIAVVALLGAATWFVVPSLMSPGASSASNANETQVGSEFSVLPPGLEQPSFQPAIPSAGEVRRKLGQLRNDLSESCAMSADSEYFDDILESIARSESIGVPAYIDGLEGRLNELQAIDEGQQFTEEISDLRDRLVAHREHLRALAQTTAMVRFYLEFERSFIPVLHEMSFSGTLPNFASVRPRPDGATIRNKASVLVLLRNDVSDWLSAWTEIDSDLAYLLTQAGSLERIVFRPLEPDSAQRTADGEAHGLVDDIAFEPRESTSTDSPQMPDEESTPDPRPVVSSQPVDRGGRAVNNEDPDSTATITNQMQDFSLRLMVWLDVAEELRKEMSKADEATRTQVEIRERMVKHCQDFHEYLVECFHAFDSSPDVRRLSNLNRLARDASSVAALSACVHALRLSEQARKLLMGDPAWAVCQSRPTEAQRTKLAGYLDRFEKAYKLIQRIPRDKPNH